MPDRKRTVMVVDDQASFRAALALAVSLEDDIALGCEAVSGEEALELLEHEQVDAVLLDINMPGRGGLWAAEQIHRLHPDVHLVLMSTYDPADLPVEPGRWGAEYVHKESLVPGRLAELLGRRRSEPDG